MSSVCYRSPYCHFTALCSLYTLYFYSTAVRVTDIYKPEAVNSAVEITYPTIYNSPFVETLAIRSDRLHLHCISKHSNPSLGNSSYHPSSDRPSTLYLYIADSSFQRSYQHSAHLPRTRFFFPTPLFRTFYSFTINLKGSYQTPLHSFIPSYTPKEHAFGTPQLPTRIF